MGMAARRPSRHDTQAVRAVTTVRHVARAAGSTGAGTPAYRVNIQVGRHHLTADEPVAAGGGDVGPSPSGLLLSALVACTATTLRMYATRKGWELATLDVEVRYDVGDDGRTVIERTITVPADIRSDHRQLLVEAAERTPVTVALRAGTPITTTFRPGTNVEAGEAAPAPER
jgi:putative redox protein